MSDILNARTRQRSEPTERHSQPGSSGADAVQTLADYVSRVMGTTPEDAHNVIGNDSLRSVRTVIASEYDKLLTRLLAERGVEAPQPVAPAVAIPLLRAAYDESRPELQEFWVRLLAAAMDPTRRAHMRRSFVAAVGQLDPLDARVLLWIWNYDGPEIVNFVDRAAKELGATQDEIQISFANLARIGCVHYEAKRTQHPVLLPFGLELIGTCFEWRRQPCQTLGNRQSM